MPFSVTLPETSASSEMTPSPSAAETKRGVVDQLLGLTGPRYQMWPERMVREAISAPHEAMYGEYGEPGTREFTERAIPGAVAMANIAAVGGPPGVSSKLAAEPGGIRALGKEIKIPEGAKTFHVETFQPELYSEKAAQADPKFARYRAEQAQQKDAILHAAEDGHQFWRRAPESDRLAFMDSMEKGIEQPTPEFQSYAKKYRALLNEAHEMEKSFGSRASFVEEYFPHIWEKPAVARQHFDSKTASLGPTWFQKERVFDLIEDGINAGLKLKTTNPEDLVTMRLLSGVDMRARVELLNDLRAMDLAVPVKEMTEAQKSSLFRSTDKSKAWQAINAPDRQQWAIAPDVQALWKNAVEAKGLWADETGFGGAFRGWMSFKNAWVPVKLALSAFHPLHVLHINYSNAMNRAFVELSRGHDPVEAAKAVGDAIASPIQAAIPGAPFLGKRARAAWLKPESEMTAPEREMVSLMKEGGFSPQLSEQLKIAARHNLEDALDNNQLWKAAPHFMRRTIEVIQAPVFEKWIPSLKAAAYLKETAALARRSPEIMDDPIKRGIALRGIAKSVDNRYGEMFYSSLFWNRYVKDAGIGSFLSLGWNLGFAREFIAGAAAPAVRPFLPKTLSREAIQQATSKASFITIYMGTAMVINGTMNYLFTGEVPGGIDWIFPRAGGKNPDGSPRRITNMFYSREIPMAQKHIQEQQSVPGGLLEMLWNKLMFQPLHEIMTNRSYFGYDIWDVNAPKAQQWAQMFSHVIGEQFSPITISGARRALQTGGGPRDVALAFLGFSPAPAYASRNETQNRIYYLFGRHVAPYSRPQPQEKMGELRSRIKGAYLLARQRGDNETALSVLAEGAKAGLSSQSLKNFNVPSDIILFKSLPDDDQISILNNATPSEMRRYFGAAHKKVQSNQDLLRLYRASMGGQSGVEQKSVQ